MNRGFVVFSVVVRDLVVPGVSVSGKQLRTTKESTSRMKKLAYLLAAIVVGSAALRAAETKAAQDPGLYPLDTCIVSGEKLGGDMGEPFVFTYGTREIKLCCKKCEAKFKANAETFVSKLDMEAKKIAEKHPYPLKTCLVSDEAFGGDMGDPFVFVADGHQVKLCCKSCLKDFKKNRAAYIKKLDDADKTQKKAGAKP